MAGVNFASYFSLACFSLLVRISTSAHQIKLFRNGHVYRGKFLILNLSAYISLYKDININNVATLKIKISMMMN